MTVSNNTTRQLFACNGVTTARTASFRVIDASQLRVVLYTIATGAAVDLTGSGTDYTVTSAGGATTDFSTTVAYSSAYKIIALLDMPLSQETDYVANDSFPAESHEAALDKLTLIAQQQADILSRCATLPEFAATNLTVVLPTPTDGYGIVWDGATGTLRNTTVSLETLETQAAALYAIAADITTVASIAANVTSVAGNAANINTVAGIAAAVSTVSSISGAVSAVSANSANINTVAGISANVTTVAGISASVATVAGISGNVTTVAGISTQITGVYNIRTDVTTVAGISGNVTTVAGISANVTTVAGISANVTTVAGNTTNINTVAGISANVTTVAGISTAVSTVSSNIADVNTCATNIAAIIAAPAAATAAAASAAAAAAAAAGISMKSSCRVATTAALTGTYSNGVLGVGATFTYTSTGVDTIDGVALVLNDRVLLKDQASAFQNGIYKVTTAGAVGVAGILTRATDYDEAAEIVEGTATIISEGTVNASHIFVMTHTTAITVGTTAIDFTALTANATSANTLTTPRAIYGNNFDGSTALTQVIASTYGGTGNGFTKFSGPTTAERTKTLRDASDTILELGGSYSPSGTWTNMVLVTPNLGVPSALTLTNATGLPYAGGGTGASSFTNHGVVVAGASALTTVAPGTSGNVLTSNGTDWTSATPASQMGGATTTSTGSDITLTSSSQRVQNVTMTTYGLQVKLPDATTMTAGAFPFVIRNNGLYTFFVTDNAGQPRAILAPGEACAMYLSDISSAKGLWYAGNSNQGGVISDLIVAIEGSAVSATSGASGSDGACTAPISATTFLLFWYDFTATAALKACVISMTGVGTLTAGSTVTVEAAASCRSTAACAISATAVFVMWTMTSNVKGMVLSISGTTVTANTSASLEAVTADNAHCFAISTTAVFTAWSKASTGRAMVASLSGTTVSANTIAVGPVGTATIYTMSCCQLSTTLYFMNCVGTSSFLACCAFSVSGTAVTAGTIKTNESNSVAISAPCCVALDATRVLSMHVQGTQTLGINLYSISGNTLTTQYAAIDVIAGLGATSSLTPLNAFVLGNYIVFAVAEKYALFGIPFLTFHYFKFDLNNGYSITYTGTRRTGTRQNTENNGIVSHPFCLVTAGKYGMANLPPTGTQVPTAMICPAVY